ncbi:MAG TPA: glycosyltransferase family 4 protein [Humidesulfovibrio sp.]|uniref:glycosyltransferase family 4 protein n=1 Tax=Humidesulfovibrio sp. TaxID=2910988 RepID=UPI002CD861B9|nr:glycosyltransferase family 4 protein [Humidesulfovibrio sp.]HWR04507.1 glycosyltransferase family 4 protein [Humidesulfovibrio sp.]
MSERRNALHIAPSVKVMGGISAVLRYLQDSSLAHKFRLRFVASHKDGSKPFKLAVALLGLCKTLAVLACTRVDIVHIHCGDFPSPKRKYFYFRLVRLFGPRVVLHLHGALFLEQYAKLSPAWKGRMRHFFETADMVLCLSHSWAASVQELFPGARRMVVPNGIPLPALGPASARAHDAPVRVTFLGLIGARKGVFDLLEACEILIKQGLPIRLAIGGNGEVDRLLSEIAPFKASMRHLGWITGDAKERLLRETDIFVLPSYGEGLPMSVLEAMSYAVPVITTTVGGLPELIRDGESGFLVEPGRVDQLVDRLGRLTCDAGLRRAMGDAARRTVEHRHGIETMAHQVSEAYWLAAR